MERPDIEFLIDSKIRELEAGIDKKLNELIDTRRKETKRLIQRWTIVLGTVLSILLAIGITKQEIVNQVRESLMPTGHFVSRMLSEQEHSQKLEKYVLDSVIEKQDNAKKIQDNVIKQLASPAFSLSYPQVEERMEKRVWDTLSTNDIDQIKELLNKSQLDEAIVNNYKSEFLRVMFSEMPSDQKRKSN